MTEISFVSGAGTIASLERRAVESRAERPAKPASPGVRLVELAWFAGLYLGSSIAFFAVTRGTHALLNLV